MHATSPAWRRFLKKIFEFLPGFLVGIHAFQNPFRALSNDKGGTSSRRPRLPSKRSDPTAGGYLSVRAFSSALSAAT